MKTNHFLSIVLVLVSSIFADTISLRNGQEIKDAVVTEVGDSDVKYKIGQRATVYIAKKADIAFILYDDGTQDIFETESKETENPVPVAKIAENEEKWKKFFGIRVAYNFTNLTYIPPNFDSPHIERLERYDNFSEYGFTIGGISNYQLNGNMAIHAEGNFIYRTTLPNWEPYCPSNSINSMTDEYKCYGGISSVELERGNAVKEFAVATNVLLHLLPFGGPIFYLEGGFQLGSSLYIWDNIDWEFGKDEYTRSMLDFGPAFGFGWHINENFMLGFRGVVYLTDTYKEVKGSLVQKEFGLSYIF